VASLLPNSPRARRRLIVAAAVLVAAGAAVLVVLLIPNNHGGIASEGTHGGESAAAPAVTTTAAATTTEHVVGGSRGRLSDVWLLVPLGLLSLIVIVPAVVFTGQWVNDRRVRRRDRDNPATQLPPLPRRDPRCGAQTRRFVHALLIR
jgi:hypothetical protein